MKHTYYPGLKAIEEYFEMNFSDVIQKLHLDNKRSIKSLSDECGVSRDTFQRQAKNLGLKLRNIQDATKLNKNKGHNHWAFGKTKANSEWAIAHSDRMIKNNPMHNVESKEKRAKTFSKTLASEIVLPQEVQFKSGLRSKRVEFIFQYPIGPYVIDFYIPSKNLCIEIDSTDKWGKDRRLKAKIKDSYLKKNGFSILRINKSSFKTTLDVHNLLYKHHIID